jgi:flagellar biosynthesis regulator FlaF
MTCHRHYYGCNCSDSKDGFVSGSAQIQNPFGKTPELEIRELKEQAQSQAAEIERLRKEVGSKASWATQMQKDLQASRAELEAFRKELAEALDTSEHNRKHWFQCIADLQSSRDQVSKLRQQIGVAVHFLTDDEDADIEAAARILQEPVPPEFEKIFQENFKDLLADDKPKESDQ